MGVRCKRQRHLHAPDSDQWIRQEQKKNQKSKMKFTHLQDYAFVRISNEMRSAKEGGRRQGGGA